MKTVYTDDASLFILDNNNNYTNINNNETNINNNDRKCYVISYMYAIRFIINLWKYLQKRYMYVTPVCSSYLFTTSIIAKIIILF